MGKNLKGKSYNEVMNEWKAQQTFLKRASTGLIRPGDEVTGLARAWGWTWRLAIMVCIPLMFYWGVMRVHGQSAALGLQLANETKRFLGAESVTFNRSRWDWNGEFRTENVKVKGSPANAFSEMNISYLNTVIRPPQVFMSKWHLDRVKMFTAEVALRAGVAANPVASSGPPPLLTAGFGINPDFTQLTIDRYECEKLRLTWGNNPATDGELAGAEAAFARNGGGWDLALNGGTFRQGWLDGLRLTAAHLSFGTDRAVIDKGDFTVPGGGSGTLTGSITFGETPEINAVAKLENVPFEPFLPDYFRNFVKLVCHGTVALTGSTNRDAGILMEARLDVRSGTVSGVPVFRALELASADTSLAQPAVTGGHVHFTSQGGVEGGSLVIDATDVMLECGTRMKLALTMHHERKSVLAATVREAADPNRDTVAVSTSGVLRIGLPPDTAAKFKPSVRQAFITREEQGYLWMDIPWRMDDKEDFTKDAADRLIALHYSGN